MGRLTHEVLTSEGMPWQHFVCCDEQDVLRHAEGLPPRPACVWRVISGERCTTKGALLQEWAETLEFPSYFGENWDAFHECIGDLDDWLPARAYALYVTHVDRVLPGLDKEFEILCDILDGIARGWRSTAEDPVQPGERECIPFHVVFQYVPDVATSVRERFARTVLGSPREDVLAFGETQG